VLQNPIVMVVECHNFQNLSFLFSEAAVAAEDWDHWRGILCSANPSCGGRHWTTTII